MGPGGRSGARRAPFAAGSSVGREPLPAYMADEFYKRFPRQRSSYRPGATALILADPQPAWLVNGDMLLAVRFAVRVARTYRHGKVDKLNRLKYRVTYDTRYSVERYEYAVVYWSETNADPVIVSAHADKDAAAQELEREIVERS